MTRIEKAELFCRTIDGRLIVNGLNVEPSINQAIKPS